MKKGFKRNKDFADSFRWS